jgi:hypothetical protein
MQGMPGQPQQPGMMPGMRPMAFPQGKGGLPVGKIIGIVAGAILLSAGGFAYSKFKTDVFGGGGPGNAGWVLLGIDPKKADGDQMITSVAGFATKWKKDATWWGANFIHVRADGTVDVDEGGATVTYVSLNNAKSPAKTYNKDSLKEFSFGPTGVSFNRMTGVLDYKQWEDAVAPALPACTIKMLITKQLAAKGLTGKKEVRITYDHMFGPAEPSWRVMGEDPKIDAYFSLATCAPTK